MEHYCSLVEALKYGFLDYSRLTVEASQFQVMLDSLAGLPITLVLQIDKNNHK